jgi:hypothetical protein
MGGHIADPCSPFDGRIRKSDAECAGRKFFGFLAGFTLLYNGVTGPPVELTTLLAHEEALQPLLYRLTNHGYHILSLSFFNNG